MVAARDIATPRLEKFYEGIMVFVFYGGKFMVGHVEILTWTDLFEVCFFNILLQSNI